MRREVLLTGATGVLGSELVVTLLGDPDTELQLLLRARSSDELQERVRDVITFAERAGVHDAGRRVHARRGDVELPELGLSGADADAVALSATHVVHAAADVRFDRSIAQARKTAVDGIVNVVRFAQRCVRGPKLDYVSTVGVAGRRTGWIAEEPQPLGTHGFRNAYEQSKAEAEEWLLAQMQRGLVATIHRPTMIVGHSESGRIRNHHGFYFLVDYFLGLKADKVVPDCGLIRMDTIPVDYVAKAIDYSTRAEQLSGAILHLCSGPRAWSIAEVSSHARALLREHGGEAANVTVLPLDGYARHVEACRAAGSRIHEALAQFVPYFGDLIEFDNRRTAASLEPAHIVVPPVESYLSTVLAAYWAGRAARMRS